MIELMQTCEDRDRTIEELKRQVSEINKQIRELSRLDVCSDDGRALISYYQGHWKVSIKTKCIRKA